MLKINNSVKFSLIFLLAIIMSLSLVSAENATDFNDDSTLESSVLSSENSGGSFDIDDESYSSYFDNDGNLVNTSVQNGDTLKFGNLSNKKVVISKQLNVTSQSNSILSNCNVKITGDGSGSFLTNLNFYTNSILGNESSFSVISLDGSSDNVISNNKINVDFADNRNTSYFTLTGILGSDESHNNSISYNTLTMTSNAPNIDSLYMYGINFIVPYQSTYGVYDNSIYSNTLNLLNNFYVSGIGLGNNNNFLIKNNKLNLQSKHLVYGITLTNCKYGNTSEYSSIENNTVKGIGSMLYLVESFDSTYLNISNNNLKGTGDAVYGIAGYSSKNQIISNNEIFVQGRNISNVKNNYDAIKTGQNGIYYMANSSNIDVFDNLIVSNYLLGGDYAVHFNNTSLVNVTVDNNVLISNNYSYLGNNAILGNVSDSNNTGNYTLINPDLEVNVSDIDYGENATISVKLNSDATGKVIITVDGINYIADLNNGEATLILPNLSVGNHTVNVYYEGDKKYKVATTDVNFTVVGDVFKTFLNGKNIVLFFKNGTRYVVYLTDGLGDPLVNKTITFIINGNEYNKTTDSNGSASIAINLNPGTYNVSASFKEEGNYTESSVNNTAEVLSTINGKDIIKFFRNGTQYHVTVLDGQGNPIVGRNVTMNINGVFYNRTTDANGTATLTINLNPGNYTITVVNPNDGLQMSNNILVKPTITGENIVKYFKNGTNYYVTVLDGEGNPIVGRNVTMNINGVFYNRTTDANGTARLAINLNPGNYTLTAYNPIDGSSVSNNITVKTTMTGNDVTKTFGGNETYDVTVLDGQGKALANQEVEINIHGVFYKRTTDSDGIARLNINLNPGDYIATAYWNGYATSNKIIVNRP